MAGLVAPGTMLTASNGWVGRLVDHHAADGLQHFEYQVWTSQQSFDSGAPPFALNNHHAAFRETHQRIVRGPAGGLMHQPDKRLPAVEVLLDTPAARAAFGATRAVRYVEAAHDALVEWTDARGGKVTPYVFPAYDGTAEALDPQWQRETHTVAFLEQITDAFDRWCQRAAANGWSGDRRGTTYNLQVGAGVGDMYATFSDAFTFDGPDNQIYRNPTDANREGSGARFTGGPPQGYTVNTATMQIWTGSVAGFNDLGSTVYAEDVDSAATYATATLWARTKTAANVSWVALAQTASAFTTSPSLVSPVQTVVSRAGYAGVINLLVLGNNGTENYWAGDSYDTSTAHAAKLDIDATAPATSRPLDDDDSMMVAAISTASMVAWAMVDAVVAQTIENDYAKAPPSGAAPVLERPDEDEAADQLPAIDNSWALALISDGFMAAIAEAALSEEWRPLSGAAPVLERPDDDEDGAQLLPPLDTSYTVALIQIAEDEAWPPRSGLGELTRPDDDEDGAQLLPPLDSSYDVAQLTANAEEIPVTGALPPTDNPFEDEDGAALLPALDTSATVALLQIAEDETIPVEGAFPVLERPDEDEDGAALLPPPPAGEDVAIAMAAEGEGWPPLSGLGELTRPDDDEDGAQLLPPPPTGDDVAIAMAAQDEAWPPRSGIAPLERPDEDEDGAQLLPPLDTSYTAAIIAVDGDEVLPVDGTVAVVDQPADEEPLQQPAPDTSQLVAVLAAQDSEVRPTSGAAPVLERPDEDIDGAQLLPPLDTSHLVAQYTADAEAIPVNGLPMPAPAPAGPFDHTLDGAGTEAAQLFGAGAQTITEPRSGAGAEAGELAGGRSESLDLDGLGGESDTLRETR